LIGKPLKAGSLHVAAFDYKGCVIVAVQFRLDDDPVRTRQYFVCGWNAISQHNVRLFAQPPEHPVKSEAAAEAVAIRPDVRGYHESLFSFYKLNNFNKHSNTCGVELNRDYVMERPVLGLRVFTPVKIQIITSPAFIGIARPGNFKAFAISLQVALSFPRLFDLLV